MPSFLDIRLLSVYAQKVISETLNDDVKKEVTKTEQRHINSDVYDVYSPKYYRRRRANGGLIADDNIVGEMISDDTLSVTNKTKFNPNGEPDLAEWVEYGLDPGVGAYADERPFTQNTIDELNSTKAHVKAMQLGLKKRGII